MIKPNKNTAKRYAERSDESKCPKIRRILQLQYIEHNSECMCDV